MPDLSNLLNPSQFVVLPCDSNASLNAGKSETVEENNGPCRTWDRRLRCPALDKSGASVEKSWLGAADTRRNQKRSGRGEVAAAVERRSKRLMSSKSLDDHVRDWAEKKVASGVPEVECRFPFVINAPKMVECRICSKSIYSSEELLCTVHGCKEAYHLKCAQQSLGFLGSRNFKCPQHACFICKQKGYWRCTRCTMAAHSKCAPWPDNVVYPLSQPGRAVCWRHATDWRFEKKEAFHRLPLPYVDEEFKMGLMWKDNTENEMKPNPYVHIRRNLYLVKKKRGDIDADVGCTNCKADSTCSEDCVCRVQSISCSKACYCSELCTNRPFRKEKKVKVVKTQFCGWGVEAAESIKKGDFVIEYIGEVIDDTLCEQRLWDMKYRGDQNFYMCEIRKDFTIDATFKGNVSRFLNHSCDPNCKLEKWQVDGETRVGVFAARSIEAGEPLTYDYRFVHFGPKVRCFCGTSKCQGYLGSKKKIDKVNLCWGSKRKRSLAITAPPNN
ncbi:histone-lysine N-methyltransferase ASHR3-like isoform X2 [Magnolia sinica]|uniref:histone-lysine N-methyltransferase ASHR3-like isoform X2 n=1 Tax=Magnolia sinica TaxID=86752 RepID=UPI0026587926|nr:histone-lysine N-methyltransferase ASHR3-like isoform X2 [Magnolia sinica]